MAIAQLAVLITPVSIVSADAGGSQFGGPMVVINPGGGSLVDGADGLRIVVNSDGTGDAMLIGQDQVVFAAMAQYAGTAAAPMLSIGDEMFGQVGPLTGSANWTSISVDDLTGSASTTGAGGTGSGSAVIHYTAVRGSLTYTMDREISYTYPHAFFTESYVVTLPIGNSDEVRLYQGGDTSPGGGDIGIGAVTGGPISISSVNPVARIEFGYREVALTEPFEGYAAGEFDAVDSAVLSGAPLGTPVNSGSTDVGVMVDWTIGGGEGVVTREMEVFASFDVTPPSWVDQTLAPLALDAEFIDDLGAAGHPTPTYFLSAGELPTGISLDSDTGAVTGTPTVAGDYDFTIIASNGVLPVASHRFTGSITDAPAWTDEGIAAFALDTIYTDDVTATGFPAPTYSVSGGVLPTGIGLDSDTGAVTGTPTVAGDYDFTITATNGVLPVASHHFTGSITDAPAWDDLDLLPMQVGVLYEDGVTATGFPVPTYSVAGGDLPDGLVLDEVTGAITGTPTETGDYLFTITATNGIGADLLLEFSGAVGAAPVWFTESIGHMQKGVAYSDAVFADGAPTVSYSVTAGALPAGLALDAVTGAITGIPTVDGAYDFTITADNGIGSAILLQLTGEIEPALAAPSWSDLSLGAMHVGVQYTDGLSTAGYPAATLSVTAGALPAGITLDPDTGELTGMPATGGAFDFTITATNGVGTPAVHRFTGTVEPPPAIQLDLTLEVGAAAGSDGARVFVHGSGLQPGSTYVVEMHSDPLLLATGIVAADGTFAQYVTIPANAPVGSHSLIVSGRDTDGQPHSDIGYFSVTSTGTIGAVSTTTPIPNAPFTPRDPGYVGITPHRMLDSRTGGGAVFAAGSVHELDLVAQGVLPSDATAAVFNVAVTQSVTAGFLTIYPCGTTRPLASNLNFGVDQTLSNEVTSFLGVGAAQPARCASTPPRPRTWSSTSTAPTARRVARATSPVSCRPGCSTPEWRAVRRTAPSSPAEPCTASS